MNEKTDVFVAWSTVEPYLESTAMNESETLSVDCEAWISMLVFDSPSYQPGNTQMFTTNHGEEEPP